MQLGSYIVDFYCHPCKLVIEVDGDVHRVNDNPQYDKSRTEELESFGLKMIRFSNEEVQKDLSSVIKE